MTSPFLPIPPRFRAPSNQGYDFEDYYYDYSFYAPKNDDHRRQLFDKEFLETDCWLINATVEDGSAYPPGTAVDNWYGTYLTNYIVAGVALVGAILVYRQLVTVRRRHHPSDTAQVQLEIGGSALPKEPTTVLTNYAFFCLRRRQGIIWYLLWFSLAYTLAGAGHQFVTNTEHGNIDAEHSWMARIAYAASILSIPGLIVGIVSNRFLTCGGIKECDSTLLSSSSTSSSLLQLQQRRHLGMSFLWFSLALVGAIYILLVELDTALFLAGALLLLPTICLCIICLVTALGAWDYCQSRRTSKITENQTTTSTTSRPPKSTTQSNANGAFPAVSTGTVDMGLDDEENGDEENEGDDEEDSHYSSSSSLNRLSSFIFAISQATIAIGVGIQAILSPLCGSKEAYQECFADCPLSSYEWNHNFIYHIIHGAGIVLVVGGALLLPR